jgi:hypothetical protein
MPGREHLPEERRLRGGAACLRQAEWHGGDYQAARHTTVTLDLYFLASEGRPMP